MAGVVFLAHPKLVKEGITTSKTNKKERLSALFSLVAGLGIAPSLEDYASVSLISKSVGLYLHPKIFWSLACSLYGFSFF